MNYNDYPSEEKQIPWKPILIVGGGLVVAVAIIFVVIRLISGTRSGPVDLSAVTAQRVAVIESVCQNATDPEQCKKIQLEVDAVNQQDILLCQQMQGDDKDGCIWEVASTTQSISTCAAIKNDSYRALCEDGIAYALAVASGDPKMCDKIQDDAKRSGCTTGLQLVTAENCAAMNQDPAYCAFLTQVELAMTKQDVRICDQFSGEQNDYCQEFVLVDDPDFDGLSTSDEELYGTDPDIADTDKDGYLDGAEVEAGYNPNGPGTLDQIF